MGLRVDGINIGSASLSLPKLPTIQGGGSSVNQTSAKSLGETPPVILSLDQIGELAQFFMPTGLLGRLRKRLNYLKNKKCTIVAADGTTACIDDEDVVYVGVGFIKKYLVDKDGKDEDGQDRGEETVAGVLAHEWGHSCAVKPKKGEIQKLNWNEIFELRRAHETLADEISGRLLYMMGYSTKGIVNFLTKGKEDTHNLKYHNPEIRAQVINYGFETEKRKAGLARQLFPKSTYENNYKSFLLDIA